MTRAFVATVLLVVCAGCASGEGPAAEPSPRPTATTSASSASEEPLPCVPGAEPFDGPAADAFGADRVMAAYCLLAGLAEEQATTSLALPIPEQSPRDLGRLARLLTPGAAREWSRQVAARAGGDPAATRRVNGLTLHDVREPPEGYVRPDDGPYVFGTTVGPASAEPVRDGEALRLSFSLETGVVLEERGDPNGRHSLLPVTREAAYLLVPDGDGWLVQDWRARFVHGPVRLATG